MNTSRYDTALLVTQMTCYFNQQLQFIKKGKENNFKYNISFYKTEIIFTAQLTYINISLGNSNHLVFIWQIIKLKITRSNIKKLFRGNEYYNFIIVINNRVRVFQPSLLAPLPWRRCSSSHIMSEPPSLFVDITTT
jgi:hypothetical protein